MTFGTKLHWTGSEHGAARDPASYSRDLEVTCGEATLPMSAAPEYRGDGRRANPEQLFVAALSSCQALTYLFLAARNGVVVMDYEDEAEGVLELVDRKMRMTRVTLRPRIVVEAASDADRARELVERAHAGCFIANSVTTTIVIEPSIVVADQQMGKGQANESRYATA